MTLEPGSRRPLLMVAGSTGLAPMKAMIQQVARDGGRRTALYFGARTGREVYDRKALTALSDWHGWLTVVTAVSDDIRWSGPHGLVGEVAADAGEWSDHDVYVCGSPAMVGATVTRLLADGVPQTQIRFEEFGQA
jgi:NAD(P)H-flavin reductase